LDCDGEGKQYHLLHVIPVYLLGLVILNGTYYVHHTHNTPKEWLVSPLMTMWDLTWLLWKEDWRSLARGNHDAM